MDILISSNLERLIFHLSSGDANLTAQYMAELSANGIIKLELSDMTAELTRDDLLIETQQKIGFYTVSDHGITVALDTELTDELIVEGFVREIVSKIQTMRKEAGFDVTDHIKISVYDNEKLEAIALNNAQDICADTLSDGITSGDNAEYKKTWDINGENVGLGVTKVK